MRLFIASKVCIENHYFDEFYSTLKKLNCLNTVKKSNLHITYLFIGDCNEYIKYIDMIKNVPIKNEFLITINGISFFKTKYNKIRVIFLKGESKELYDLGNYFNKHFTPHITIARNKYCNNEEIIKIIKTYNSKIKFKIYIDEITLYNSKLTRYGPIYEKIYSFKLK